MCSQVTKFINLLPGSSDSAVCFECITPTTKVTSNLMLMFCFQDLVGHDAYCVLDEDTYFGSP